MEEGFGFRIIDVYLADEPSPRLLHQISVRDDPAAAAATADAEEIGPDESVQQQMRELGLPTRFSSVPRKIAYGRSRRRHRSHQVTSSLHDQSLLQSSLSASPFYSVQLRADDDNGIGVPHREANNWAGGDTLASSRDHQDGKSVCVSNSDDHLVFGHGAVDVCGIVALDARVQADVSPTDELGVVQDSTGWLVHERARILNDGGPISDKEGILPESTWHSFELNWKTKGSPDKIDNCASSRVHREGSSCLELNSIDGAGVSLFDHHVADDEEASLLSCEVIDGTLSCGMVAQEAIDELHIVSNSRQPLNKERARTLNNGDWMEEAICEITATKDGSIVEATFRASNDGALVTEEAFAVWNCRAAVRDEQITTLSGLTQKVMDEGSLESGDARGNNVMVKVAQQGVLTEDLVQTLEVLSWSAHWDNDYGRYFFHNTETLESTWEPPKGFESYAYVLAVDDNDAAVQDGLVNSVLNSEELKESEEEILYSEDGPKSDILAQGPLKIEALPIVSAVKEALSSDNKLGTLQSDIADATDGNLSPRKDTDEGPECILESCQVITCSASTSSAVQVDVTTAKVSEPTRQEKMAARWLVRLENQGMDVTAAMGEYSPTIIKYWAQRFHLFSKYDLGVKLDEEGWFSVTPEAIAKHQAARCRRGVIVDAFTGVGGNAIQFALADHYVVGIDNDPRKIEYARHNAIIYGVADRIDFVLGDFFAVSSSMQADVVFLSPPWGGPDYLGVKVYDIMTMLQPKDGISLFKLAQAVAPNIIFFLPRNVDMNQLAELSKASSSPCSCEVERNYLNGKLKAVTAYYGQFVSMEEENMQLISF